MTVRAYLVMAAAWVASLATVGVLAQGMQRPETLRNPTPQPAAPGDTNVKSGSDLGFRVDRTERGTPVGRLVVRVNGQWVEAGFTPAMTPVVAPR